MCHLSKLKLNGDMCVYIIWRSNFECNIWTVLGRLIGDTGYLTEIFPGDTFNISFNLDLIIWETGASPFIGVSPIRRCLYIQLSPIDTKHQRTKIINNKIRPTDPFFSACHRKWRFFQQPLKHAKGHQDQSNRPTDFFSKTKDHLNRPSFWYYLKRCFGSWSCGECFGIKDAN